MTGQKVQYARINTKITVEAHRLLMAECDRREVLEAGHVSPGRILNELVIKYLQPEPVNGVAHKASAAARARN